MRTENRKLPLDADRQVGGASAGKRYGFALLLLTVCFAARLGLSGVLGSRHPYLLFIPAALMAAWYGRLGPALMVLMGGYLLGDLFFHGEGFHLGPYGPSELVVMLSYATISLMGIGIVEALHRTRDDLLASEAYRRSMEKEIQERRRAEQALLESEREYRALFESNPHPTWVLDTESLRFLAVNEAAIRHYGYSREEFLKMTVLDIRPPEEVPVLREYMQRIPAHSQHDAGVWRHRKKNGALMSVEITSHGLTLANRPVLLVIARDITERRQAEQQLRRAQDELREYAALLEHRVAERTAHLKESLRSMESLLYHVAHDLRAPLRAMHGFTHLLIDRCSAGMDSGARDFGRRIMESATKMDCLITDLLEFGRLGHQPIAYTRVDFNTVLKKVLAGYELEIQARHAEIEVIAPLPEAWGDVQVCEQVLGNLVENALKFVDPDMPPRIRIRGEQTPTMVRLVIEDNGIGIAQEYQERIFGVFERLHDSDRYPGTGIGLAIVQKGLERMGGRVGVESQPGLGSRFWIELSPPGGPAASRMAV